VVVESTEAFSLDVSNPNVPLFSPVSAPGVLNQDVRLSFLNSIPDGQSCMESPTRGTFGSDDSSEIVLKSICSSVDGHTHGSIHKLSLQIDVVPNIDLFVPIRCNNTFSLIVGAPEGNHIVEVHVGVVLSIFDRVGHGVLKSPLISASAAAVALAYVGTTEELLG
jgi:hypothetical protein